MKLHKCVYIHANRQVHKMGENESFNLKFKRVFVLTCSIIHNSLPMMHKNASNIALKLILWLTDEHSYTHTLYIEESKKQFSAKKHFYLIKCKFELLFAMRVKMLYIHI